MTLPRGENPYSETGPLAWEIPSASDDFDSVQILYDDLEDSSNEDILQLLKNEKAHLKYWVSIAREYYRRGRFSDFENTLDTARKEANITYDKSEEDQVIFTDFNTKIEDKTYFVENFFHPRSYNYLFFSDGSL